MQNAEKNISDVVETSAVMNKNADIRPFLTDADMSICPESYSETFGFAQMIISENGYNFVRQIHCIVNTVSENHAEGHYMVPWTSDYDPSAFIKWELYSDFIYDGEIDEGFPNGNGTMKFINGTSDIIYNSNSWNFDDIGEGWEYSGSFQYGIPHGEGHLSGPDGTVISGTFKNGMLVDGKILRADGSVEIKSSQS